MQFTTITALLAGAAVVAASPLDKRTDWKTCPAKGQYYCKTDGILNLLTCVNAANDNTIKVPINIDILKREEAALEKRTDPEPPVHPPPGYEETCCTTNGILNILTCVNLLNGNTVIAPINLVIGILYA